MYIRNPKRGVLATPYGCWQGGEAIGNTMKLPSGLLQKWLKSEEVLCDDNGPEVDELPEHDILSTLTRQQLLHIIKENELPFRSKLSWTDEAVRQAIRDTGLNLATLKLPTELGS